MRSEYAPSARAHEKVKPATADRTAIRDCWGALDSPRWGDVEIRTWPNRAAMARQIRREERHAPRSDWRPVVALALTEGF